MPFTACQCGNCPNGAPESYAVALSGIINSSCTQCAQLNSPTVYNPTASSTSGGASCIYLVGVQAPCGFTVVMVTLSKNAGGGVDMTLTLQNVPAGTQAVWSLSNIPISDCLGTYTLAFNSAQTTSTVCTWTNSTASVAPVFPQISDTTFKACVAMLLMGCPRGTLECFASAGIGICLRGG
jgi:hypothetical protein